MFKRRNTLLRSVFELALTLSKTESRACIRTHSFEAFLDPTHPYSEWRRNRRRPGECRAGLAKYAAARPLFALRAGRMAASGIICRGTFLGSDVALTRAPKVPPYRRSAFTYSKLPGAPTKYRSEAPTSEDTFWGKARRRGLLYSHARGTSPDRACLNTHQPYSKTELCARSLGGAGVCLLTRRGGAGYNPKRCGGMFAVGG